MAAVTEMASDADREAGCARCHALEIELRDGRHPTVRVDWSASQLVRAVAVLQRANARGADVFIRPAGAHGLVLVAELDANGLERLTGDGFEPAATLEVRPGHYEAWVRLSPGALPQVLWNANSDITKPGVQKPHCEP